MYDYGLEAIQAGLFHMRELHVRVGLQEAARSHHEKSDCIASCILDEARCDAI